LRPGIPGAGAALQRAQDAFEAAGGYDADKRIGSVLQGLGFKPEEWTKSCAEFSGGWQARPPHLRSLAVIDRLKYRCTQAHRLPDLRPRGGGV
jgi:hypothetical protein